MRSATLALALAVAGCTMMTAPEAPQAAVDPEQAAVLQTVDAFLLALGNGDTAAQAALELPDSMIAMSRYANGSPGPVRRVKAGQLQPPNPAFDPFMEWYWNPVVQVRGPLAQMWAPYELRNNGAVVHCGIDAFQLVKVEGAWKIHSTLSTMEPASCEALGASSATSRRPRDGWRETRNE